MGLIENEVQLPGSLTEVTSQYSYGYDTSQFGTTESVVIAGTAFHGPTGVPVAIYNPEHAEYTFGKGYDSVTKKEATLVPAIKDAYEKGCRTIYAVRVSGTNTEKDFQFAIDTPLRLRVQSAFPTNDAKDYFLTYENKEGQEAISFYKPAARATIVEKRLGIVESDNDVLVNKIDLASDYSMDKDTDLLSVISLVNDHSYNNVIRLSIVDETGLEVTYTSEEARRLTLGALLPGLYTMGRSSSNCTPVTTLDYKLCIEPEDKPFDSFEGVVYKSIELNTDVSSDLPIYAQNYKAMKEVLNEVSIFSSEKFDFLKTQGLVDRAFQKDEYDYEEVDISNYDLYEKLGSGFAITAYAERRVKKDANGNVIKELTPRIRETPLSDKNRIKEIRGGVYSILENLATEYRVLAGVGADEEIKNPIPRAKDFQVVSPVSTELFKGLIEATPVVDEEDIDNDYVKSYRFEIQELEESDTFEGDIEKVHAEEVMEVLPLLTYSTPEELKAITKMSIENGTRTLVQDSATGKINLYIYDVVNGYRKFANALLEGKHIIANGKIFKGVVDANGVVNFEEVTIAADGFEADGKFYQYVLGENKAHVYVFEVLAANLIPTVDVTSALAAGDSIAPIGDVETMFSENEEKTTVYAQSNYFEQNDVIIRSAYMDNLTVEELVEKLNTHSALNHIFKFSLTDKGSENKDEYLSDIAEEAAPDIENADGSVSVVLFREVTELPEDREVVYNYSTYIPYKTSDNFARHLAQHAKYTSIKTGPTHGIIGISLLNDTSLRGVSKRVDKLLALDLDMYVKTNAGKTVLGSDNLPYPVGNEVSVIEAQNVFVDSDSTTYLLNGASSYAGMVSTLPKDQSSTNQPIDIGNVKYTYSNYQLSRLTQAGFVTIKDTITKGLVITDGITMGPNEDPRRRLAVTRIINEVQRVIRAASEPFIGKPNNDTNRNSLETAIKSELEALKGVLVDSYEFKINTDRSIQKYSYIDIDYAIRPVYEIREVRHRVTVKDEI